MAKVTVRKGPPLDPGGTPRAVVEVWLDRAEATVFPLGLGDIADAAQDALKEHLRSGFRVHRVVKP